MTNSDKEREELLRRGAADSFVIFSYYYDWDLFRKRPFLKEIAQTFQDVADGKLKRVAVSLPPRAGKSYITTLFCAWMLGKHPTESVMRNTCTATLSRKLSYDSREVLKSEKFMAVFPDVKLSDDKGAVDGWNTNHSKSVGYFGQGVGGTIIGFGATKVAITDDLFRSFEDAMSETIRDKVHSWYSGTHLSRKESGCAEIDIGTRWVREDVIGANSAKGYYDKEIIVPALDVNDKSFCEDVLSTEEYLEKRTNTPKEIWMAEYQQQPSDIEGRLFESVERFSDEELKSILERSEGSLAYIDVADEGVDYLAMAVAHLVAKRWYITDVLFTRDNTDITIPLAASLLKKNKVQRCAIETNNMGAMFTKEMRKQGLDTTIQGISNTTNKNTRIIMASAFINRAMVFVENPTGQYAQFLQNLFTYSKEGKNKHDDAPDCLAGLTRLIQVMFGG